MHAIVFAAKRVHLRTVAYGQRIVKAVKGMTPARFDLLYAMLQVRFVDPVHGVRQVLERWKGVTALARQLGLHRTTVSKMVKRLVEMGWLRRRRLAWDRRYVAVALSERGWQGLVKAMVVAIPEMRRVVAACFRRDLMGRRKRDVARAVAAIFAVWWHAGRFFRDGADLLYVPPDGPTRAPP